MTIFVRTFRVFRNTVTNSKSGHENDTSWKTLKSHIDSTIKLCNLAPSFDQQVTKSCKTFKFRLFIRVRTFAWFMHLKLLCFELISLPYRLTFFQSFNYTLYSVALSSSESEKACHKRFRLCMNIHFDVFNVSYVSYLTKRNAWISV